MFWLSPLALIPLLCAGGMLISYAALGLIARPIVGIRGMAPIALFSLSAFLACLLEALALSTNLPQVAYWLEAAQYAVWIFLTAALGLWFERLVSHSLRLTALAIASGVVLAGLAALLNVPQMQFGPAILLGSYGVLRQTPTMTALWIYGGLLVPTLAMATTVVRGDQRRLPRKTLLAGLSVYIVCLVLDGWSAAAGSHLPRTLVIGLLALQLAIHRATGHKLVAEYLRTRTMNHLRSRLMDSLSHELRTPLGVVKGYLEMTLDETFGPLTAQQTKVLNTALDNVNQEVLLIDDLLLSAQLERGLTTMNREQVPLEALLQQAVARTARTHRDKPMQTRLRLEHTSAIGLSGDGALLARLFDRLLDNAWLYAPENSLIEVETQTDELASVVRIRITDTGPGISPALIEQIAEPFAQATTETEGQVKGLGLGLSLAREICRLHGGQLTLRNNPQGGLTAEVELPTDPQSD